jgi:two-component system NarL family response regulator
MDRIKVGIVDDQKVILQLLSDLIAETKDIACVGTFTNAESYIDVYEQLQPDITLIDMELPGMSGAAAMRLLIARDPTAKFILLSTLKDDASIFKALQAGACGYLLKKNLFDGDFLENLRLFYKGHLTMSAEIGRKCLAIFKRSRNNSVNLTEMEENILMMMRDGMVNKEISLILGIPIAKLVSHIGSIYEKLHLL